MRQTLTLRPPASQTLRFCAGTSRFLLGLVALLLTVMPWTEHFCEIDHFLRGGQDFELGLLAVLAVLCLILLLLQQGHVLLSLWAAFLGWLALLFREVQLSAHALEGASVPQRPNAHFRRESLPMPLRL